MITFSYSLWVKHSDKEWATRMDHYMNYGDSVLDWESFGISIIVTVVASLMVCCMFASILNKDFRILDTLRSTYRDHSNQIRRRVRTVSYGQVGQNSERDPAAPLRREAVWKKLQGDVFRGPNNPLLLSLLIGAGV
jgi:transmembrane 9 superfamily protein 2/4